MSPIEITCATPTHPPFSWLDSLDKLEEGEIEGFVLNLRGALAAFSMELKDRRELRYRREPDVDQALENYKKQLRETAEQINKQGLTKTQEVFLVNLTTLFAQAQCAKDECDDNNMHKAGREYLWLISSVIGWPYALLIVCTLGRNKIERLKEDHCVKLLRYIHENRELLYCCGLDNRAVENQSLENGIIQF